MCVRRLVPRRVAGWLGAGALALYCVSTVGAQQAPRVRAGSDTAAFPSAAGIFVPGRQDLSIYTTPLFCVQAVLDRLAFDQRSLAIQRVVADAKIHRDQEDTLPTAVVTLARRCGQRFRLDTMPSIELPAAFQLALLEREDSLAVVVADRALALAATERDKAKLVDQLARLAIDVSPARVAVTQHLLAAGDQLGSAVVVPKTRAHRHLLKYATAANDTALARHEAEQIIRLLQPVQGWIPDPAGWVLWQAYTALADMAFVYAPDSVPAVLHKAIPDLARVFPSMNWPKFFFNAANGDSSQKLKAATEILQVGGIDQVSQPTPRLQAAFWKMPVGAAADTVVPLPGVASLIVQVPYFCHGSYTAGVPILATSETGCETLFQSIRRWHAEAGGTVRITLVAATQGAAVLSEPETPQQEGDTLGWFFRQYLQLPFPLTVQITPMQPPDTLGEIHPQKPYDFVIGVEPFLDTYHVADYTDVRHGIVVLTGADGRMRFAGDPTQPAFHLLFSRLIVASRSGPTGRSSP